MNILTVQTGIDKRHDKKKERMGLYVVSVQTVDKPEYLVPARRERRIFVKRV